MLKGNHLGKLIISTGIQGTEIQEICPKRANEILVKTFAFSAPPFLRIKVFAFTKEGLFFLRPDNFSFYKYKEIDKKPFRTSRKLKGPTAQGLICKQTALRIEHDPIAKNSRNLGEDFRKFSAKTNDKN